MSSNNSSSNNNNNKKAKMSWDEEWQTVRQYILSCPILASSSPTTTTMTSTTASHSSLHPAIEAALKGMDMEWNKRQRDLKLQQKFSTVSTTRAKTLRPQTNDFEPVLKPPAPEINQNNKKDDEDDEWQTVEEEEEEEGKTSTNVDHDDDATGTGAGNNQNGTVSFLGNKLAMEAVRLLAEQKVACSTCLQAMAVLFHACLILLDWECTGIPPPQDNNNNNGFAAPVRALTTFLPPQWNTTTTTTRTTTSSRIQFRYRPKLSCFSQTAPKANLTSIVLTVQQQQQQQPPPPQEQVTYTTTTTTTTTTLVQVIVTPHNGQAEPVSLEFSLSDFFNLDSWNKATSKTTGAGTAAATGIGISPILHYKALPILLTQWMVRTQSVGWLDLTSLMTTTSNSSTEQNQQQQPQPVMVQAQTRLLDTTTTTTTTVAMDNYGNRGFPIPTTVDQAFFSGNPLRLPGQCGGGGGGDFASDLLPGGGNLPSRFMDGSGMPSFGGNLMGPQHPMFGGRVGSSGGYLQPRFDPYGPPPTQPERDGIPFDMDRTRTTGTHGMPNPSHLRPPNNLGNNTFM